MQLTAHNNSNLFEVPVGSLDPGMYVGALDRPWLESPFAVQGFYVENREDIDFVSQHCVSVFVDPRRRKRAEPANPSTQPRRTYRDTTPLKNELKKAEIDLTSASDAMGRVFDQLKTGGHFDIGIVRSAIQPLIDSIMRNNEAMAALVRIKKKGAYLFNHSISVAVWAAILGRHLGLERVQLEKLALGAALLDVGMASVDEKFINSTDPLSESEFTDVKKHVPMGVDLLRHKEADLPVEILEMIASHHERHNGTGYPKGAEGLDIPLFARIAAIVDSYDAMITPRAHATCRSSFEAMQELSDLKDQLFQGSLVEQFMQAVGLFPTGSIVQLNTSEIGVVVQQNAARRLRPKVVLILDSEGHRHDKMVLIDLAKYTASDGGSEMWITQELEPGAYGIQPDEYFL
jgi:HD-GYP domain-containing protein (c-di-GMP phosphodiesterase class II)